MLAAESPFHVELCQSRQKTCFVSQLRSGVMIGMAAFPVGKNHDARSSLANHARNFQTIVPGVLDSSVGDVERLPPSDAQNFCGLICLARAVVRGAPSTHLAAGEIENAGTMAALRHLKQSSAAGLLYVVAMCGYSQDSEIVHAKWFNYKSPACAGDVSCGGAMPMWRRAPSVSLP